jgi:uncharacterized iron-regulated protein
MDAMWMMPNRRPLAAMLLVLTLTGCALSPQVTEAPLAEHTDAALVQRLSRADILLLGEIHDNVEQHRRRLDWLRQLARDRRLIVVMEQLDADAQPRLDAAREAMTSIPDSDDDLDRAARSLADAGGFNFKGWDWGLYGPVIRWALREGIEVRGANLSPAQAMSIARGQAHRLADQRPPEWAETHEAAMAVLIREGHCGLLPERMIAPMVRAQRARDARMAQAVLEAVRSGSDGLKPLSESAKTRRPMIVLLAGNGHVRSDLGVPRHLSGRLGANRLLSLGLLEINDRDDAVFDEVIRTKAQVRDDPCESLRKRFGGAG